MNMNGLDLAAISTGRSQPDILPGKGASGIVRNAHAMLVAAQRKRTTVSLGVASRRVSEEMSIPKLDTGSIRLVPLFGSGG
jgi:hypothetical protein